ncbi:uncharacterized protein FMAN_04114 [Fusarium mangiferae]|uniref:Uncharacterized protein n=1 Tax=Fusarium mangiferae TaxID=192010 RepID=A0A1L7T0S1_FUSMA|nr:uncharacterized protein FMAN_04114 [Fusarium mangiferae]CVK89743.1 uncharacterized protein FMAN_04114 [Fusarium mangiferae]
MIAGLCKAACHPRKQLGAVEARRAHNPEATGSKPVAAMAFFLPLSRGNFFMLFLHTGIVFQVMFCHCCTSNIYEQALAMLAYRVSSKVSDSKLTSIFALSELIICH